MEKDDCANRFICQNAGDRCLFCDGNSQFKEIKYNNFNDMNKYSQPSKKKKGMDFEEKCRVMYNEYMAHRTYLSGGFDGMEEDIFTPETVNECKGTKVKEGGKKQISFKKSWYDEIKNIADKKNKIPFVLFGFEIEGREAEDEDVLAATSYDNILTLLRELKNQREYNESLERENKLLKKELKGYQNNQ